MVLIVREVSMRDKLLARFVGVALVVNLLVVFSACKKWEGGEKPREVILRQEWFANANFAGAVLAAKEFAPDHKLAIRIEEGSEEVDPIALVAAGRAHFGDAAADRVMAAIARGVPLVIIGVVNPSSPTVFLAKVGKNIHAPRDFEGHSVGVLTGTATEYVYRALLRQQSVDVGKVREVEAGFDLQGFLADQYEVRPAFAYDEPVSLRQKGVKFITIDPRDYGVHFIGTVYFTRKSLLQEDPEIVQDFINSVADGWRLALADPPHAIDALHEKYQQIDKARELESLKLARDYVVPPSGRLLLAGEEDWEGTISALAAFPDTRINPAAKASDFVDNSFVTKYHDTEADNK